jgi:hypothetical protein
LAKNIWHNLAFSLIILKIKKGGVMFGLGWLLIIPAAMLLTVSFFVMFTLSKLGKGPLRVFGMVLVVLLWITALLVFSKGICSIVKGSYGMGKTGTCPAMKSGSGMMMSPQSGGGK